MYSVNRTPRMDVETEPIHFTQDDHHSIQERPTHGAPIGSRTPATTGEDDPRKEWKVLVTFSVTPVPMEHSSDLRAKNKVLTVARLYMLHWACPVGLCGALGLRAGGWDPLLVALLGFLLRCRYITIALNNLNKQIPVFNLQSLAKFLWNQFFIQCLV